MRTSKKTRKICKHRKSSKYLLSADISLRIKLSNTLTMTTKHILHHPLHNFLKRVLKFSLILLICQSFDWPAVVIPENGFVILLESTPHMVLNLDG